MLAIFLFLAYAPFLGSRVIRPAGDDKVYVSQAIEMAHSGHWFLQSLANEPNFYKGPLHYILLRIGMKVFGESMWATTYMNLLFILIGAISLGSIVHRHLREFDGWSFWVGAAFALNAGIFSHAFASQMEVETAGLFCLGLYFLDRSGPGLPDLKFWLVAGLVGWIKSPLHSALLGGTALLFWGWNRELLPRLMSIRAWGALIAGILLCVIGYLPAYFGDREHFINAYVFRENLWKPPNGSSWYYPVIPLFTYFLFPWMLPAFVAYVDGFTRFFRNQRNRRSTPGSKRVIALGLSLLIPSVLFFSIHPYRGQNYDLPTIGGLMLVIAALWSTRSDSWNGVYAFSMMCTAILALAVPVLVTIVSRHFDPMPFWWPSWELPVLWLGFFLAARGFWREGVTLNQVRPASMSRRSIWLFLALGTLLATLGEREMIDIRDRIHQAEKSRETLHLSYYNLERNIWSEWGYLNFMIPFPVSGLFNDRDLEYAVAQHDLILVPGDEWLADMSEHLKKIYGGFEFAEKTPWRRWKTKGKDAQGVSHTKRAWERKDLSELERNFYMVRVVPKKMPADARAAH